MRLFIAIALPEEVQDLLAGLEAGLPGARWVPPDNLHITLRFLGEIDGRDAQDIDAALSVIQVPAFKLTISGLGQFGDDRKVRQLWAGVQADPTLQRLQGKVESAVVRSGQPPERRKFKPHVTLARFSSRPEPRLGDFIAAHALFRLPPFTVDSFSLFSSVLTSDGSVYREEAVYPLAREIAPAI